MALFGKDESKDKGLISVIQYEGDNNTLVWKHPKTDFNYGTQLIVRESQEAVFFRDGQALDLFPAGRHTLETQNIPVLSKLYSIPTGGDSPFTAEVYFVNLVTLMGVKWGTDSKVRLFDPQSGLHLELGASGEFNIRVSDPRKLLVKLVGTTSGLNKDELLSTSGGASGLQGYFRGLIMTQVKSYLAQVIKEDSINVLEIDENLNKLSNGLKEKINLGLADYGLVMPEFYVVRVVTPDEDPNFKRMKQQYADQYLNVREEEVRKATAMASAERQTIEAQTEARMKIIGAQGDAESLKIQAEAEAAEMRMKGYTYQQETARMIGMEAMQNGLIGEGGGSGLGDIAGLGVTLGAMGGVIGMTKDAMAPVMQSMGQQPTQPPVQAQPVADGWSCCGATVASKFCPNCGGQRPRLDWDCACGQKGITSKFCQECGTKRGDA